MNATTTNTQTTQDQTVADLLTQTTIAGSELVAQAPTTETTNAVGGKVGAAVDAVKTAAGASLDFLQEHKTAVIAVAGVAAAAGVGYAAYKWCVKRRDKRAKAEEEAAKAGAYAAADAAVRAGEEAAKAAEEAVRATEEAARAASFAAA